MGFVSITNLTESSKQEQKVTEPKQEKDFIVEDYNGDLTSTHGVISPTLYIPRINEFTGDVLPFGSEQIRWDSLRQCFIIRKPRPIS